MASVKHPVGSLHEDVVIAGVQSATNRSAALLHTRPSSTPARLSTRNSFGSDAAAGNTATIDPETFWFQAGTAFGNHTRISYVDDNSGSSSSNQTTILMNNLDTIVIGAESASTFIRGFYGHISLVGLHTVARGTAWLNYWNTSLTQGTFWGVGSWVSDSTELS